MKKLLKRTVPLMLSILLLAAPVFAAKSSYFTVSGKAANCTLNPNFKSNSSSANTYWATSGPKGYRLNTRLYLRYNKNMAFERKKSVTSSSRAYAYYKADKKVNAFKSIHSYIRPNKKEQIERVELFEKR